MASRSHCRLSCLRITVLLWFKFSYICICRAGALLLLHGHAFHHCQRPPAAQSQGKLGEPLIAGMVRASYKVSSFKRRLQKISASS